MPAWENSITCYCLIVTESKFKAMFYLETMAGKP